MNEEYKPKAEVRVGSESHVGSRDGQEDFLGTSDFLDRKFVAHAGVLGILADGMGGFAEGQLASQIAVERFLEAYGQKTPDEPIRDALLRSLFAANDAVLGLPASTDNDGRVGTTLVAAVVHNDQLHWISVGDSRAYLVRGDSFVQLTTDHTYATELQRQVLQKVISAKDAGEHPQAEVLTSYVGHQDLSDIDCNMKALPIEPEDYVLLCSDGLHKTLTDDEIFAESLGRPQEIANALVKEVLERKVPHQDNVSVVVLYCESAEDAEELEKQTAKDLAEITSTTKTFGIIIILLAAVGLVTIWWLFLRK